MDLKQAIIFLGIIVISDGARSVPDPMVPLKVHRRDVEVLNGLSQKDNTITNFIRKNTNGWGNHALIPSSFSRWYMAALRVTDPTLRQSIMKALGWQCLYGNGVEAELDILLYDRCTKLMNTGIPDARYFLPILPLAIGEYTIFEYTDKSKYQLGTKGFKKAIDKFLNLIEPLVSKAKPNWKASMPFWEVIQPKGPMERVSAEIMKAAKPLNDMIGYLLKAMEIDDGADGELEYILIKASERLKGVLTGQARYGEVWEACLPLANNQDLLNLVNSPVASEE